MWAFPMSGKEVWIFFSPNVTNREAWNKNHNLKHLHVQVSWMRSSDMSVLTVGGLVFSSDPRIGVVTPWPGRTSGTWSLQIQEVSVWDSGDYQCQVNTQTKERLDVELVVRGQQRQLSTLYGCY